MPPGSSRSQQSWRQTKAASDPAGANRLKRWFFSLLGISLVGFFVWYMILPLFGSRTYLLYTSAEYDLLSRGSIAFPAEDLSLLRKVAVRGSSSELPRMQSGTDLRNLPDRFTQIGNRDRDTLVLYLNAHGIADAGSGYLLCGDFPFEERLDIRTLLQQFSAARAKLKLLILDAVHLEADPRLGMLLNDFPAALEETVREIDDPNLWVLSSCSLLEKSHVSYALKQSIFAHFVSRGLAGEGDADNDDELSLDEFCRFVQSGVMNSTTGQQTPQLLQGGYGLQLEPPHQLLLTVVSQENEESSGPAAGAEATVARSRSFQLAPGLAVISPSVLPTMFFAQAEEASPAAVSTERTSESSPAGEPTAAPVGETTPSKAAAIASPAPPEPKVAPASPRDFIKAAWKLRDRLESRSSDMPCPVDFAPHLWREFNARLLAYESQYRTGAAFDTDQLGADLERIEAAFENPSYRYRDTTRSLPYRIYEALRSLQADSAAANRVAELEQIRNHAEFVAPYFVQAHAAESYSSSAPLAVRRSIDELLVALSQLELNAGAPPSDVDRIERQSDIVRDLQEDILQAFDARAKELVDPVRLQDARSIEAALATPLLRAERRMELLDTLLDAKRLRENIQPAGQGPLKGAATAANWRWERLRERAELEARLLGLIDPELSTAFAQQPSGGDDKSKLEHYRAVGQRMGQLYAELPEAIAQAVVGSGYDRKQIPRLLRMVDARDVRDVTDGVYPYLRPLPPLRQPLAILRLDQPAADARNLRLNFDQWTDLNVSVYSQGKHENQPSLTMEFNDRQVEVRVKDGASVQAGTAMPIIVPDEGSQRMVYQVRVRPGQDQAGLLELKLTGEAAPDVRRLNLTLPASDRVEVHVRRLAADSATKDQWTTTSGEVSTLRPFPNRDTNYYFAVSNRSEREKKVRIDLLSVPRIRTAQPPSADQIASWQRQGKAARIGGTDKELVLPVGAEQVPIPFASPVPPPPAPDTGVTAAATAAPPPAPEPIAVGEALACVVTDTADASRTWVHWINLSTLQPWRYVDSRVRYDARAGQIGVDVAPVDFEQDGRADLDLTPLGDPEGAIHVSWDVASVLPADTQARFQAELKRNNAKQQLFAVVKPSRDERVLVKLDIDGYPRAMVYDVSLDPDAVGEIERERELHNVEVQLQGSPFINISPELPQPQTIGFKLLIDAPEDIFQEEGHAVEYGIDAERNRDLSDAEKRTLTSDRDIRMFVTDLDATGLVALRTSAQDFNVSMPIGGYRNQKVNVHAQLMIDGQIEASDFVEVTLDATNPELQANVPQTRVFKGDPLSVHARSTDLSGIREVGYKITRNRNDEIKDDDKLELFSNTSAEQWQALVDTAPLNPGEYTLLVRATDNVLRHSETRFLFFTVAERPKPPEPMPEKAKPKPTRGTLEGVVRFDGAGYSGAKVRLSGPISGSTTSGAGGAFKFNNLPAGTYTIEVEGTPRNKIRKAKAEVPFEPPKLANPVMVELQ